MINKLTQIIEAEEIALKELLGLFEIQYKMIMEKDVFGLEGLVDKLNECNKKIAGEEVKRRQLIGKQSIKDILKSANDEKLNKSYEEIQKTLNEVTFQKETNEMLLKQQIMFNNQMLNVMNPNREMKTYNSYGNLRR
ncbi:flagellar protein FlgN [Clostridium botulinum]|uniref:flagellar protein FlgN n=1 Tax=Clostridium botulinum TaxID=1491 RepID=UPI000773A9F4|nr:flagellar protein FlgN [Clostridium botulinum]NFE95112.1 flagellar protein FlgN [Clostridium botulinum]NFH79838.1 flagellar protein FlgN [Clostridium botulinum]NFH82317.1 flagellar protein FlgN [Clostridium botulinum]NFH90656.1 flagellar protein FlgN [Clostridium botulinum]NFI11422.1 flagellar protein FlgN [Clostridium botulinum]